MGNLGGYQTIVEWSKKLGGPGKFVAALLVVGAVGGGIIVKGGEVIVKKGKQAVNSYKEKKKTKSEKVEVIYTANISKEINEGLTINEGDQFMVLADDGNAVMVELLGNDNNPYFVDADLLRSISDYDNAVENNPS